MKSVLISIQPYWVFLIIAKIMGWNIGNEKMVEVRKNYPKAENWNKAVKIYCSKDKKSFSKIPKEYQPLMERFLGKVIGEFVCDIIEPYWFGSEETDIGEYEDVQNSCVPVEELLTYAGGKEVYFWSISQLKIYDKPKPLSEFHTVGYTKVKGSVYGWTDEEEKSWQISRPPQSWCYVEGR